MTRDEHSDYELPHYSESQASLRTLARVFARMQGVELSIPANANVTYVDDGSTFWEGLE